MRFMKWIKSLPENNQAKIVFLFGLAAILLNIIYLTGIKGLIKILYTYLIQNPIFTAIIGALVINYMWKFIESEHKRYDSLVYLERLFGENYNLLRNNKALINSVFDDKHLTLHHLIFQELIPIDRDKILKIKYLDFINSVVVGLIIKIDIYNRLISEYKPLLKDIQAKLYNELDKQNAHGDLLDLANKACLRQLEHIQKKTIELIDLFRVAFAKASVLAREDRPWLVRISLLMALIRKGGEELVDKKQAESIINILRTQEEKCDLSTYDELNEKCKTCEIKEGCKKYFSE